ncbi:hypothetical protein [Caballeronia sp. J97]|uniref:hypothetical protein n=1 Tax=Caballeronia sp. J97 TaxID=2805429 RepID=UPI002AB2CEBD|nr:hypothetical protein [Caballeronia sp. J97]
MKRYLDSGDYDSNFTGWPGDNFVDVTQRTTQRLKTALVEETLRRTYGFRDQARVPGDLHAWARDKLSPMVNGLFPADEHCIILDTLARSVVFLTPENITAILAQQTWLSTAWDVANIYLASVGAPALSQEAIDIVGLSEETTCFVSTVYFEETDPFADFLVHEAAHIFHNCKRATVGLNEKRHKEFLLNIDYCKRETFAYACEAYSRIISLAEGTRQRQAALARHAKASLPADDRVDHDEYLDILGEAVRARNGWQKIPNGVRRVRNDDPHVLRCRKRHVGLPTLRPVLARTNDRSALPFFTGLPTSSVDERITSRRGGATRKSD